jgi:hypothetical protein
VYACDVFSLRPHFLRCPLRGAAGTHLGSGDRRRVQRSRRRSIRTLPRLTTGQHMRVFLPQGASPPRCFLRPDRRSRATRDCDRAIPPDCYAARLIIEKATSWRLALQNQAINTIAKSEISEIDESTAPVNSDGIARHQRVAKSSNGSAILHGRLKAAMTRTFPQRRRVLFAQMCRAPSKTSSRS